MGAMIFLLQLALRALLDVLEVLPGKRRVQTRNAAGEGLPMLDDGRRCDNVKARFIESGVDDLWSELWRVSRSYSLRNDGYIYSYRRWGKRGQRVLDRPDTAARNEWSTDSSAIENVSVAYLLQWRLETRIVVTISLLVEGMVKMLLRAWRVGDGLEEGRLA